MTNTQLESFEISNFKKFDKIVVKDIGKINLIVGDNNVGKTTLLEALSLSESLNQSVARLIGCLFWRNIKYTTENTNLLETFFRNRNQPNITFGTEINQTKTEYNLEVLETANLTKNEQDQLILKNIGKNPQKFTATLTNNLNNEKQIQYVFNKDDSENYAPFINSSTTFEDDLIQFYSELIQQSKTTKKEIISRLSFIIPDIENIEITTGAELKTTFLITLKNQDNPIILNQFGDATIKLFRYILELMKCMNERIMIDEIDTGFHYSKMKDFLKIIFEIALKNNVQVFATTHSKDCIESFIQCCEEMKIEEDTRIVRIAETKSGINSYTMKYNEYSNALIAESEIR